MVLQDNSVLAVDIRASGTSYIAGTSAKLGIGTTTPGEVLEVVGSISSSGDFDSNRVFKQSPTSNNYTGNGDIIYVGGGSTTKGDIVYMATNGQWASAKANAVATSTSLLGIALGTDPDEDGVLLRGTYTLDHDVGNNQGVPLYLSDTTAGQATATIPNTSADVVRIIGYNLGDNDEIWFNPDNTFVVIA